MKKTFISFTILAVFFLILFSFAETKEQKTISFKVEALAYCFTTRTSCGTRPTYGTIAVDPRVIPYGSKIYVPGYGWGKALDTGSSIRGNKIDIWLPTYKQCINWGRRWVTIKVIYP